MDRGDLRIATDAAIAFSEHYARLRLLRATHAREGADEVNEEAVQCIWYDSLFTQQGLETEDGRTLRVISPGWWNQGEGPDFKGAQLEINGRLRTGDVEIHLKHGGWTQHGHHLDDRYNEVRLHVVLDTKPPASPPITHGGTKIPTLLLSNYLESDVRVLTDELVVESFPYKVEGTLGHCAALVDHYGSDNLMKLLDLAGEWRMLFKARALRRRMEQTSASQAVYESFLSACGFSHFKHHFEAIARQLPYDRARQLAKDDPFVLEAALLQIGGLFPDELPDGTTAVPHFGRLRSIRRDKLSGLRSLPLQWKRVGVRPNNNPERRLAGAALFFSRTAKKGILDTLEEIWAQDLTPLKRRKEFENLFPKSMGFWASHCTWTGKRMAKPSAPIGSGRVRSIIGNVFVPMALAQARQRKDRIREETVFRFFESLPKEPSNKIQKVMAPRLFGIGAAPRLNFRTQQGLLQMFNDWCEPNPSCRNCRVIAQLDVGKKDDEYGTALTKEN